MYKKVLAFLAVVTLVAVFVPMYAFAAATVSIIKINGQVPSGTCLVSPITIEVAGTNGSNGGTYYVDVDWGDGLTTTNINVGSKNASFDFTTAPHTMATVSTGLSVFLHHSTASGNDSHSTITNLCSVPPTTAVLIVSKNVVNTHGGTATASSFTLHVKNSSNVEVPNGGNGVSSPFPGSATGMDVIITPAGGAYTVSEDAFAGYTQTGITGDCASNGTITLVAGNSYSCTITNNDNVPKINPTLSVTNSPVTYNGSAQSATVTGSVAGTVSNIKYNDGSTTTSTPPTNTGTYAVTADFTPTDTTTYNSLTGASAGNFIISKAASTTTVTCSGVTYNASVQTPCTVSVTGAGGLSLTPTPSYSNNTNAGTATASYTYAGDANHNGSTDSKTFTIAQATADCSSIVGYSGVYDGSAHGATGTCTGVGGATLNGLNLGSSFKNVPGGTANWTFTDGTGNYNSTSGSATIDISAKTLTVSAQGINKVYDGNTNATVILSTTDVVLGDAVTETYTTASFADPNVNTNIPVSVDGISIAGADAGNYSLANTTATTAADITGSSTTITLSGGNTTVQYDGNPHSLSFTASPSVAQINVTYNGSATAPTVVGTYSVVATAVDPNYSGTTTATLTITPAPLAITADNQTKTYGDTAVFAGTEFSASGLLGSDAVSGVTLTSLASPSTAPVSGSPYSITANTAVGTGLFNYTITYNAGTFTVNKAGLTVTPDNQSKLQGTLFTAFTGTITGLVNGDNITATYASTGAPALSPAGTYDITATLNDPNSKASNYNVTLGKGTLTVSVNLHTITASAGSNGSITQSGPISVADGTDETFTITANGGYHVADVLVDGSSVGAVSTYTFASVTADHTISASFAVNPPSGGGGGGGGGSAQCSDGRDNDGDGLIDSHDPECHTDGNASNYSSYNPMINDEGSSGSVTPPAGKVLGAETSCGINFSKYLRKGYKGNNQSDVSKVQKFLNDFLHLSLKVDGQFGTGTETAVKKFQSTFASDILAPWHETKPTGIAYLTTITKMNNLMCPTLQLPIPVKLIPWNQNPAVAGQ